MKYLTKTYVLLSFLSMLFLAFCFCSPLGLGDDDNDKKFKEIIKNVRRTLSYLHYQPQNIDDDFSEEVFDRYLETLDGSKIYFKKSDIEAFTKSKDLLDDFYKDENLSFYKQTVDTLYKRAEQLEKLTETVLESPLDYTKKEEISFNYDSLDYAASDAEWKDNWRKYLKYNVLQEILILEEEQEKDSTATEKKSFAEMEKEARNEVVESMKDRFRRFKKRKKTDWVSIYINAFTESYDPHTSYFSPKENEDFEMTMSGQLEGIGASLQDQKGYATVMSLVIGGPAWKDGELEVGDQITKVAQGKKEAVNIVGMLLDDAIRLIRGKKGTEVVLTVKKKDGTMKEISITRDIVELEETFARSAIIHDENNEKYGIIYLPSFYLNYDGKGHDASDDIKKEIETLKEEGVKGIVFDLRNNGGGDLDETVEIAGHFISKGPVVQVRRSDGKEKVYEDKDKEIAWNGPLVVLVNELSASASEIFAAAMQDYQRGVIIGGNKTYGKGTVQTMRPLSWLIRSEEEYGALKFTIQKFYRINGGSTQRKGVASDIVIPGRYTNPDIAEDAYDNALLWDQISAVDYSPWSTEIDMESIKAKSAQRIAKNDRFMRLEEGIKWIHELEKNKTASLDYETFKKERKEREAKMDEFDDLKDYENGLSIFSPKYEEALMAEDTVLKERRKKWHENLGEDMTLEEAINVLRDLE